MDDIGRCAWGTVICLVLTLIAMFFSAAEVALVSLSESKLKKLADEENKKATALYQWKNRQYHFTVWASTSAVLCMIAACCVAVYIWVPVLGTSLQAWFGWTAGNANKLAALFTVLVSAFLVITLGQTLPKKLVTYRPEPFAFFAVGPVKLLGLLFRPLAWLPLHTARLLTRLFGYDPNKENATITEENIRMLVDAGNEKGTIEPSEREMINNIFEFDDRTAGEVMTHRTDLSSVSGTAPLSEVISLVLEKGYSRIPVYGDDIDDVVGILYAKDLLELIGNPVATEKQVGDYMRPVIYVPESTRCRMLFRKFKETKIHMAVIVDEYGGTAGIATMEDLLEAIVGNIQDEYDQEIEEIQKQDDGSYSLDGGVSVEEVEQLFDADLDADEDTDTIGGLIANTLGRIPQNEEIVSVVIKDLEFTVMVVEERRIVRVRARRLPEVTLEED